MTRHTTALLTRAALGAMVLLTVGACAVPLPVAPLFPGIGPATAPVAAPAVPAAPTVPRPPQTAPSTTPGSPVPSPVVLEPSVPGWSPVRSTKRAAVYDAPPGWQVESEDTIVGFETKDGPRVAGSGAAKAGVGACGSPNSSTAMSVIKHDPSRDLAAVSTAYARQWADAAYRDGDDRKPRLSVGAPKRITTLGGQKAVVVKATAAPATVDSACRITRGAVWVVTATGYHGELGPTVSLIIVADEKLTGAQPIPQDEIRKMLSTLRPAP